MTSGRATSAGIAERPRHKEILLEDERGRYGAAVVRYGPYLFLSGSDGDRDPATEQVDVARAKRPEVQVHNSYGRVQRRLEQCGYPSDTVIWLQHFVNAQDYLLLRLAIWKQYFGLACTGGGSEAKMAGLNMLTTVAVGVTPDTERAVVAPSPAGPHKGIWAERKAWTERVYNPNVDLEGVRPAKSVRAGDFVFTIGVRGLIDPANTERAPVLTADAFDVQLRNSYEELRLYLEPAGLTLRDLVRLDIPLRDVNRQDALLALTQELIGDRVPCALHVVGMPLAGTSETDMQGMAVTGDVEREVIWSELAPDRALAVRAGGMVFVGSCSGLVDHRTGDLHRDACADKAQQASIAVEQLADALATAGSDLSQLLRLDVFVRDIYFADEILRILADRLGPEPPAISVLGGEPAHGEEVELSAIAATAS